MADAIDLTELERLCQEATAGPWHYDGGMTDTNERGKPRCVERIDSKRGYLLIADPDYGMPQMADAEVDSNGRFIAAARTALPALLAQVRMLQSIEAAVAELRAADEAWLRRHPRYQRPKGVVLPHDKLYALLGERERNTRGT